MTLPTASASQWVEDVYFVNFSDEVLNKVSGTSGGFMTIDEDSVASRASSDFIYDNVLPNKAVKIGTYDAFSDSH